MHEVCLDKKNCTMKFKLTLLLLTFTVCATQAQIRKVPSEVTDSFSDRYPHDADDDHKVTVVTAVVDSAKAYAYWKSDMLKKRREAAGVTGTTERFVFRIIQRY